MKACKACGEDMPGGIQKAWHSLAAAIGVRYRAWSPEFCHELAQFVSSGSEVDRG